MSRIRGMRGVVCWMIGLALMACDAAQATPRSTGPNPTASDAQRLDYARDLARLAAVIGSPLPLAAAPRGDPSAADAMRVLAAWRTECLDIGSKPGELRIVARQTVTVIDQGIELVREWKDRQGLDAMLLLLSLGELEDDPPPISEFASDKYRSRSNEFAVRLERVIAQRQLLGGAIARLAMEHFAPAAAQSPLAATFHERQLFSLLGADTLIVTNVSGRTLNDCILNVSIRNAAGERAETCHYVRSWAPGQERRARYESGTMMGDVRVGRATVGQVQTVVVSLWARELSYPELVLARK